ncbi:MAG: TolC family protein [Candidatus Aminicenantes bacterium]|nr:TolC family protein [Candidatus Aminicenantes bacterium]
MSIQKTCVWLLVFVPWLLGGAEERFDLQRFVNLAVRNSQNIQIAQEAVSGAEQKISESKSLYYPQVNLTAGYSRLSLVSEFDFNLGGEVMHFKFSSPNNYSFRLVASQQLFNWGRSQKAVQLSRLGLDLAEDAAATVRQMTAYQVIPIYYNLLFAGEAVKVLDETRELFAQKLNILKARFEAGMASDFDLSLIQVQMSAIDSQKADLNNSVRKLILTYNRIANRPLDADLVVGEPLDFQPMAVDEQQFLQEALANRVEFKQLRDQEALLATQAALARTGNKPNLLAAFTYEIRNGFLPSVDQLRGNWTLALSAVLPLFDGFRTRAQVSQAEISLNMARRQRQDQEKAVAAEIRQLASDLRTLEEKMAIEKVKMGHAQKALKIAEERSARGLISTTDLIEAHNALANSRLSVLQFTVNYILNRYSLFRTVGRKIYQE